ncbi:DUF4160 domain-containing protein [Spirosoma sp. KCTC 42546]|uniref:DUF4160 domain-containing protein n=1 Tax=Spirosoma sp. KCTC 42546 TaxID=2520506 RepID=UPI00115949D1|nr:DUF4160 domain-containing protein [Spirosoma sp. KCTC 42546]QDK82871.1 DUF4160 domain-containing protein [Spirosoma sp. KCTC 42546]
MPTYFILSAWRYFARSYDLVYEPCHVHAQKGSRKLCKYWVFADGTIELADSKGLTKRELSTISAVISQEIETIKEAYESYCRQNRIAINYKTRRTIR